MNNLPVRNKFVSRNSGAMMTRLLLLPFYACLLPTLFACAYPMDEKHKATENIAHEEFLGSYALSVASLPGYDIEVIQEDGSLYVVFERQTPLKLVPICNTFPP